MRKLGESEVNAFAGSCIHHFEKWAPKVGRLALGDPFIKRGKVSSYEVSAWTNISGDWKGKVFLSLGVETALELAEDMTSSPYNSFDHDAQGALLELIGLIMDEALEAAKSKGVNLKSSPLSLSYGNKEWIGTKQCSHPLTIPIQTDLGKMELDLALA